MNYEDMSDHEINMAVTCIENNCQGWATTARNTGFYHCGIDGGGFYEVECVDYCSNPSDAWPIIIKNKIGVMPAIVRSQRDKGVWIASEDWSRLSAFDARSENPLRATMICFLKMKDAESD